MPYNWLTFLQLKTALANRLSDPNKIFWIDDELGRYIKEALRTLNSIGQFYRDRVVFNTQANFPFYDLTQNANPSSIVAGTNLNTSTLLGYSLKDRDLINDIEYNLIEPITVAWPNWTGTDQFIMDDLTRAIERQRNLFLYLTACHLTRTQINYLAGNGKVSLSNSIQQIIRASWIDNPSNSTTTLYRSDEDEADFMLVGWNSNFSTPSNYSTILTSPPSLQLIPPPSNVGIIDLLTVTSPLDLDESTGVLLNIPNDFSWILKYGALSDLLNKDGQAFDPTRASYCAKRFNDGIKIALLSSTINQAFIDSSPIVPCSISELDELSQGWQNLPTGTPLNLAIASRNLIALSPIPSSNLHSIQLDVLINMPIPTLNTDLIQIGKEHIDLILDYSTHLAMFKVGGMEFQQTIPLADNFMQKVMLNNSKLSAEARNYSIMQGFSNKQEKDKKRFRARTEEAA